MLLYPFQVDQNYYHDTDRSYLAQFFPNRTLIFTEHTLGYSESTLDEIVNSFGEIDQIIIDVTHNPYDSNCPKLIDAYNILSRLAPTIILSSDFSLFYNPQSNFVFFPLFLWAFSAKNKLWWNTTINFDCELDKSKLINCFNGNPHWHRIILFNLLVDKSWFNKIVYSFGDTKHQEYSEEFNQLTELEIIKFNQYQKLLPISVPNNLYGWSNMGLDHTAYSECVVNLTTETNLFFNIFTEKTAKPFMAKQIPILLSSKGSAQFCKDVGLDMFEDIIPWKLWDNIEDIRTKMELIVKFLDNFTNQDPVTLYNQNKDRLESNKHYFHSSKFRNILLVQLNKFISG